jgi:hypothetical protein
LQRLYLYDNALAGPIPSSIGALDDTVLVVERADGTETVDRRGANIVADDVFLYVNALTGHVPSSMEDLSVAVLVSVCERIDGA